MKTISMLLASMFVVLVYSFTPMSHTNNPLPIDSVITAVNESNALIQKNNNHLRRYVYGQGMAKQVPQISVGAYVDSASIPRNTSIENRDPQ